MIVYSDQIDCESEIKQNNYINKKTNNRVIQKMYKNGI